jgi:hypothetical protein
VSIALAAIALGVFGDRRREAVIDRLPPHRTSAVFVQFARSPVAVDGAARGGVPGDRAPATRSRCSTAPRAAEPPLPRSRDLVAPPP